MTKGTFGFTIINFLILFYTLSSQPLLAEDNGYDVKFTPKLQKAYFEIQKLRIQPARELIDEERSANPNNAFISYLDNYADLHYLLISEDKNAYKKMIEQEERRLSVIGKLPDSSPFKRFFQAEIRLHWAFAKMKFGNEVSGAWDVIKAYRLLEENHKKFPDFLPTLKSLGLLHVMIGSVPDSYIWVTKILGLKGNIKLGIKEIEIVIKGEPLFQQEAQLIDLLIHAYILQLSDEQRLEIRQLPKSQPDNLLLHFFATTILMKEGKSRDASVFLNKAPSGSAYIPFPFLDYLKGEIALQQGNYDVASAHYLSFQKQYKGFNFIKDGNFKLFMCHWLSGDDKKAALFMDKVGTAGSTIVEGDKFAQRMSEDFAANRIISEQKVLFKTRYASDGGYLDEATSMIAPFSEKSFATIVDKAEFNYRKGRILQKRGMTNDAVPFYQRTIALTQDQGAGFGASAALQLGYIYRESGQPQKAASYFKKAISYKKHEYKNSIDNKAKAALTEQGQ